MSSWKLPGYVVEELLGFGATGDVWRGRVASTGELVALKRIVVGDVGRARAVHTEAALLATLDHPHLVRLHELIPSGDSMVLVLDLAAGGTLAQLVEARGRVTPGEVITALAPVGAALAYAHNAGVVHGDVTPANVLFTDAGMPMLADLGVARLLGDEAPVHSTPAHIDPAVAAGCVPGPQSDVFMLGAVTLYALTGRALWPGDTPADVLAAAAAAHMVDVDGLLGAVAVPEPMRAVLTRALSVEPSLRGTAAEFALDLRHAGTPVGVELSAGRQRVVATLSGGPTSAEEPAAASSDSARPPFARPRGCAPSSGAPVLTHVVHARPRPVPARRAHHARSTALGKIPARRAWVAAGALLLAGAVAFAWSVMPGRGPGAAGPARSSTATRPVGGPAPIPSAARAGAAPTPSRPGGAPLDASRVKAVLTQLDARRQQAYAERDASLLRQVYGAGPLLGQDSALLRRIVPTGCSLVGVRTSYDRIRLGPRTDNRVQLAVRATLSDSVLVCGGTARGRAPGVGAGRGPVHAAHRAGAARIELPHRRHRAVISGAGPIAGRIRRRHADGESPRRGAWPARRAVR